MKQDEYFVFPNEVTGFNPSEVDLTDEANYSLISPNLYRVQKMSKTSGRDYWFRHHLEAMLNDDPKLRNSMFKRINSLKALEGDAQYVAKIDELMAAVDSYIPTPVRDTDKPFLMPVEDVFTITGRGTVATGRVERGQVNVGDTVEVVGLKEKAEQYVVTGLEMFRKTLDSAVAGDNVGALLRGVDRKDIERGQVLAKPGSINPHTKFKAEVYVLTKEEGGRHTPFFSNYRPQFYFRTTDVTGVVNLPEGVEMCMPGDNVTMNIELITPIAIEEGLRFAIREGGHTVGAGVVTEIEG